MKETDQLYIEDYSHFKDQTNQHLKRPALVTIQKPYLQSSDMEDTLIRLLRHEVPPHIPKDKIKSGPGDVRALVFGTGHIAHPYDVKEMLIGNVKMGQRYKKAAGIIHNQQNLLLNINEHLVKESPEDTLAKEQAKNTNLNWFGQALSFVSKGLSKLGDIPTPINAFHTPDVLSPVNAEILNSWLPRNQDNKWMDVYKIKATSLGEFSEDEKKHLAFHRIDLYLFYESDHKYLDRKNKIINTDPQSDLIFYTGDLGLLPKDQPHPLRPLYCETLEISSATKYKDNGYYPGRLLTSPTNKEVQDLLIKKVWGEENCKKREHKATLYHYVFEIQSNITWQIGSVEFNNKKTADILLTKIKTQLDSLVGVLQTYPIESNDENVIKDYQKSLEDKKNELLQIVQNSYEKQCLNIYSIENCINDFFNIMNRIPNTFYTAGTIPVKKEKFNEIITWCKEYNTMVNAEFALYNSPTQIPLLSNDVNLTAIRAYERYLALRQQITRANLTTQLNPNLDKETLGSFQVKYYSILLKKIETKYKKYKIFFDKGVASFPYLAEYNTALQLLNNYINNKLDSKTANEINTRFLSVMDTLLFGPYNGFYITSLSSEERPPVSPFFNSEAITLNDFVQDNILSGLDTSQRSILATNLSVKNDDVSNISITRCVSSGSPSTCQITIKNFDKKYNYTNSQQRSALTTENVTLGLNDSDYSKSIFEPLDVVTVYLPTKDGKLKLSYTGIVQKVTTTDAAGYNSLLLNCTCMKRLLDLSRTNMKPSCSRDESGNNSIIAFNVPEDFYNSIERWMPTIVAQSLSYITCQPTRITEANFNKPLWTKTVEAIKKSKGYTQKSKTVTETKVTETTVNKKSISKTSDTNKGKTSKETIKGQASIAINDNILSSPTNLGDAAQLIQDTNATPIVVKNITNTTVQREASYIELDTTNSGFTYQQVMFNDPLYTYLWYKTNSQLSLTDKFIITTSLQDLLWEYTDTFVVGSSTNPGLHLKGHGIASITQLHTEGERACYVVYKQRHDTIQYDINSDYTLNTQEKITYPRATVFKLLGTTQPAFNLEPGTPELQFSSWKTNSEIIKEVANKYDFIFYTDRTGTILFTPYNLDLSTLASNHYTQATIDSSDIYETQYATYLETQDSNYQILKKKDITDFKAICDEQQLLNWVTLTGSLQLGNLGNMIKAVVQDPRLIAQIGYRAAKPLNILGCASSETLAYYGLCWLDRNNKRYLACDVSGLYDSNMDVNMPYYMHSANVIFYAETMSIKYAPGSSCTYTLGGIFGRRPIASLSYTKDGIVHYRDAKDLISELKLAFKSNTINPSVFAQYLALLSYVTYLDSAIHEYEKTTLPTQTLISNTESALRVNAAEINNNTKYISEKTIDIDYNTKLLPEYEARIAELTQEITRIEEQIQAARERGDMEEVARLQRELEIVQAEMVAAEKALAELKDELAEDIRDRLEHSDLASALQETKAKLNTTMSTKQTELTDSINTLKNTLKTVKVTNIKGTSDEYEKLITLRNSIMSIVCYNGYLWDNISGLTFEEMPYYNAFLLKDNSVKNFEVSIFANNRTQTNIKITSSILENLEADPGVINAYKMWVTNVISISESKLKAQKNNIFHRYDFIEDLKVSPLIKSDAPIRKN